MPALRVEIDFANSTPGGTDMILNSGVFGTGTFGLGRAFVDVTKDLVSGSIQRGLNQSQILYATAQAGTLEVELRNTSADYDPTNEASPYWNTAGGHTEIQPMRRIRVRTPIGTDSRVLWNGYVDSFDLTYPNVGKDAICTVHATDALKVLGNIQLVPVDPPVGSGELTGARIARILDAAGWGDDVRDLADGTTTLSATALDSGAWAAIQLAAESEIGAIYIGVDGSVVFRDSDALSDDFRSKYRQAIFGDGPREYPYVDFVLSYTDQNVANDIHITRVKDPADDTDVPVEQTASDTDSQTAYLLRTFSRTDLPLETDAEASDYADAVLARLKDPELSVESLTINPIASPDTLFAQVFAREIGDRIEVHIVPPGRTDTLSRTVFIRGIAHSWDPESWQTEWTLADASYLGDGIQVASDSIAFSLPAHVTTATTGAHSATVAISAGASIAIAITNSEASILIFDTGKFDQNIFAGKLTTVAISETTNLAVTTSVTKDATVAISAGASITATASATKDATVAISSSAGSISITAEKVESVTVAISAGTAVSVTTEKVADTTVAISTGAALTITAVSSVKQVSISVTAGSSISVTAEKVAHATVALSTGSSISVTAEKAGPFVTGPNYATAETDDGRWDTPGNACDGDDASYAAANAEHGSGGDHSSQITLTDFGFDLTGYTLDGVVLEVKTDNTGHSENGTVSAYIGGATGTELALSFPSPARYMTFGSSTDTLGFTATTLSASTSGIHVHTADNSQRVYAARITAYYH